ncbi:MAG: rod shape-determining protein MreC [Rickettsiales bacterium]|nr:rod shape-determining protein MreC [Rickettsiales bacterium]
MASRRAKHRYLTLPNKLWLQRATLLLLLTGGCVLLVMSKSNNPHSQRLRTAITDVMAPVLSVLSRPVDAVSDAGAWVREIAYVRAENLALKKEHAELLKWQAAAKDMQAENDSLRSLLKVVPPQTKAYITARIVSDIGGPYVQAALISAGHDDGMKKDLAVINDNGLVGRTIDIGEHSSRVLLLNDINSRVPVVAEKTREKSILAGNNHGLPKLSYLVTNSKIQVGERIITSGDGGVFPAGIPVGVVVAADNGDIRVQPFVDPASIDYVTAIDYDF